LPASTSYRRFLFFGGIKMAYVYILTNILNEKQYIGKTTKSVDVRLSQHLSDAKHQNSNIHFHKAIRKYGIENFHIECLEVSDKLVNLWEIHLILRWQSKAPNGYNLTDGGEGNSNPSEEIRRKNSEAHLGKIPWNKGKIGLQTHSEETKKKISERMKKNNKQYFGKNNPNAKAIILIHPNGTEEYFDYMKQAGLKYDLDSGHLTTTAQGKRKHHKGYKIRYI
jgi:group I intron endonuclease